MQSNKLMIVEPESENDAAQTFHDAHPPKVAGPFPVDGGPMPIDNSVPSSTPESSRPRPRTEDASAENAMADAQGAIMALADSLKSVLWGQDQVIESVVMALVAGGHVLLEGAPGLGKTQLVRTLAKLVGGEFSRIQFTPDLMPTDVVGTSLVVTTPEGGKDLKFRKGPIFANLVLADEINRATPKTQSALLEAMGERTVSVDGQTLPLPNPFFVLATENPIEMEGVFPLPEAQLDRFLFKLIVTMPNLEALARIGARAEEPPPPSAVTSPEKLVQVQRVARQIASADHVQLYAAQLVLATHQVDGVRYGAGPRAAQALMKTARVRALVHGRSAVAVEDLQAVAGDVLRHRLVLGFEAEAHGLTADQIVHQAIQNTPAPK